MSALEEILEKVLEAEGGYSDHPADRGGKTMYGISEKLARDYGYKGQMRDLSLSEAKEIYKKAFWNKGLEDLAAKDMAAARIIFDMKVLHGPYHAATIVQNAMVKLGHEIDVDGKFGPRTFAAVGSAEDEGLRQIAAQRRVFIKNLVDEDPKQKAFEKGWFNRCSNLEAEYPSIFDKRPIPPAPVPIPPTFFGEGSLNLTTTSGPLRSFGRSSLLANDCTTRNSDCPTFARSIRPPPFDSITGYSESVERLDREFEACFRKLNFEIDLASIRTGTSILPICIEIVLYQE